MRTSAYHVRADEIRQIARTVQSSSRGLIGVIAVFLLFALIKWAQGDPQFLMVTLVMAATGALLTYAIRWYLRRVLRGWINRHAICPAYLEWDDAGFRTGGCAHGEEGSWPWSAVTAVKRSPDFLILKMGRCMQIVPKRAFGDELEADFERHLAATKTR